MKKRALFILFSMVMLLSGGCGEQGKDSTSMETETEEQISSEESAETDDSEMFTNRDSRVEYREDDSAIIWLNGDGATCSSNAVQIAGSTVTIQEEGTYILRGNLDNGTIVVNAKKTDKLQIVLDDVTIHSETSAPIYILQADKVFVTLAEDTTNVLSNGGSFEAIDENNIDAVIFSKEDLTLNGLGSLQVTSPAGHGIISKDDLVFTGGTYTIECAAHGLDANDSIRLKSTSMTIDSGKDGMHAENSDDAQKGYVYVESGTYQISAEGDGISAGAYLQVEDGSFEIIAGGGSANSTKEHSDDFGMFGGGGGRGKHDPGQGMGPGAPSPSMAEEDDDSTSMKAMKATGNLQVNAGSFLLDAADDAVHAHASVTVNGGVFEIATGDDAFHADETLTIASGEINITESYEGLEGLHIKVEGGDIHLVAGDDGLNAAGGTDQSGMGGHRGNDKFGGHSASSNGTIVISGGDLYINASGDGIDANGTLEISGGTTILCGPTRGDTAVLDFDTGASITGGTFIGTGAAQMAQTFTSSEQGVISVRSRNQIAGSQITLTDSSGNTLISYQAALDFDVVILSNPEIIKGETYTITIGEVSGEFVAN